MIKNMAVLHITEAELARDVHGVLEKVRAGAEVVIEEDHRAVAVIKTPRRPGRSIDECIALAKEYEARFREAPVPDPDFAKDVQAAIDAHREPLDTSAWD
jgi:antitoxin (DNA-binding transcriptional repressor) of toxin-antitoxin stability system